MKCILRLFLLNPSYALIFENSYAILHINKHIYIQTMKRTSNTFILFRDLSVSVRQEGTSYELIAEFPAELFYCRRRRDFPL